MSRHDKDNDSRRSTTAFAAPCAEYSADFQLHLLGIDPMVLDEPVLDLGCGGKHQLLDKLLSVDVDAYGLDPSTETGERTLAADWFSFSFERGAWGTIISHMAFSRWALTAHLSSESESLRYASLYRLILESLRPGGVFIYSPGLPFFEQWIESPYRMQRREIVSSPSDIVKGSDTALTRLFDESVFYTALISREE